MTNLLISTVARHRGICKAVEMFGSFVIKVIILD